MKQLLITGNDLAEFTTKVNSYLDTSSWKAVPHTLVLSAGVLTTGVSLASATTYAIVLERTV